MFSSLKAFISRRILNRGVDARRFWNGEPIASPKANVPLFGGLNKKAFTLTYEKESRDCVWLSPGEKVEIKIHGEKKLRVKLSFACNGKPKISEGVGVYVGDKKVVDLKYIVSKKWHNVGIEHGGSIKIINTSASKLAVAHPVVAEKYVRDEKNFTPKNIIVILLDSLTRDSIGPFNPEMAEFTPNITRFFEKSVKYSNCFSQSEWTLPSIYSLLTSRYPLGHGMLDLNGNARNDNHLVEDNLPQRMRELGYSTFAYSTIKVFHPAFYAHVGFDRFIYDQFPQPRQTHADLCAAAITQLHANSDSRNFMFLHFLDTHEPWSNTNELDDLMLSNFRITDPFEEYNFYKRGYKDGKAEPIFDETGIEVLTERRNARLANVDLSLQALFDYLEKSGQLEDTVVALFSDHGCLYTAQNQPLLCESRTNVPLLILHPKYKGGTHAELVATNLDIGSTLLSIAGGDPKLGDGVANAPFAEDSAGRSYVISESIFGDLYKVALRDENYVYHYSCSYDKNKKVVDIGGVGKSSLFARKNENLCVDLSGKHPDAVKKMHDLLLYHLKKYGFDPTIKGNS